MPKLKDIKKIVMMIVDACRICTLLLCERCGLSFDFEDSRAYSLTPAAVENGGEIIGNHGNQLYTFLYLTTEMTI